MASLLDLFTNLTSGGPFNFLPGRGDNQVARISNVNKVIKAIESMFSYRVYDLLISIPGPPPPTGFIPSQFKLIATGINNDHGCTVSCNPNYETCCEGKNLEDVGFTLQNAHYSAPGVYEITFGANPEVYPSGIAHIGFFFSPFSNPTHQVTVDRIATPDNTTAKYLVKTYIGGIPADGVLNNTVVATKTYFVGVN